MGIIEEILEKINFYAVSDKKQAFENLSSRYKSNCGMGGVSIVNYIEAKTYVATRMPATISAIKMCLGYLPNNSIDTILDVGAGTGAGMVAVFDFFKNITKCVCVEKYDAMIKILRVTQDILDIDHTKTQIIKADAEELNKDIGKFDFVIASYSLNEISDAKIDKVLENVYNLSGRYILLIEAGTPIGYKRVMKYKKFFIDKGSSIVAPCKCDICPLENDYCAFLSRVDRPNIDRIIKDGKFSYEDENFSFVLIDKLGKKEHIKQNIVIRRPEYKKGLVKLKVCTSGGVKDLMVSKREGDTYKKARKLEVGDQF